ncbi:hypothetical protein NKDENANG_02775 [Candidatus Entotheonellaceae bacterium PAL068K]
MSNQHLRPSQIITTFGPGSIIDLPDDSVMIAGIEHWFSEGYYKPHRKISEPRLQTVLNVSELRTPPVGSDREKDVPFVRFPRWRACPRCNRLSDQFRWPQGNPDLPPVPRCDACNVPTYPARIVVACTRGHIDDFPWYRWVHRGQTCRGGNLFLRGEGKSAALGDLRVECTCGRSCSLSGALGKDAMAAAYCTCQGRQPWLNDEKEDCAEQLYALQRGASNVYFAVVRSALSIPPWSDPLQAEVASWWGQFRIPLPSEMWSAVIQARFPDEDEERVRECIDRLEELETRRPSIRREEYLVFDADQDHRTASFEARRQAMSLQTEKYVSRLVALPRLREVRALVGFTRIDAPEMDPTMQVFNEEQGLTVTRAPLSARQLDWLPAVENLGEGLFLGLNLQRLRDWENQNGVKQRAGDLLNVYSAWRQKRGLPALRVQLPRLILLHTLAHLLMRYLSLGCGYSSASLRERIYADETMAGLLIYTSTPGSDGSLGGLVRQTKPPERFEGILISSGELARICSSDPLCREHNSRHTKRLNGAACHACAMVSETSCEFGNRLLDRGMVVRLPREKPAGYFDYDA